MEIIPPNTPDHLVINFHQDKSGLYARSIDLYKKVYAKRGMHDLFIRHDAYSYFGSRLEEYKALHVRFNKKLPSDLSDYWRILNMVLKCESKYQSSTVESATIAYFKWRWGIGHP